MTSAFYHWPLLLRDALKRDWRLLTLWVIGLAAFAGGFVPAFTAIGKGDGLVAFYETMKNPAMVAITGPTSVKTAADYTVGAMYSQTMLLYSALIAAIVAALFVVAHTRREEEQGLSEYLCSFQLGRQAGLLALAVELLIVHVLLALAICGLMMAFGEDSMPAEGCLLFALGVSLGGLLGGAMAAFFAQLVPTASAASGASLAVIGALYLLRALSDIASESLSRVNPLGSLVYTYPFTENARVPLVWPLLAMGILLALAFLLQGRRDFGSAYFYGRAAKGLGCFSPQSAAGLLVRLNCGTMLAWLATLAILGAAYGSIYGDMEKFLNSSPLVQALFAVQGQSPEEAFTATILVVLMGVAAILPVVVVNKLCSEEAAGHLVQLLATRTSRRKLYVSALALAVACAVAGCLLAAASLGAVGIASMQQTSLTLQAVVLAGLNVLPAMLVVLGLAAVLCGFRPRLRLLSYCYLVYAFMLAYFQQLLDLPTWLNRTSVFTWLPEMPLADFDGRTWSGMLALAMLLMITGGIGYERRDFRENET